MFDATGRQLPPANGNGQQGPPLVPFPVMCQGVISTAPTTKLCWDNYFAIIQQHFRSGMSKYDREQLADEAMAMAITACERLGAKIDDQPAPGWRKTDESTAFGQPLPAMPED
jgi:hypothetical protein